MTKIEILPVSLLKAEPLLVAQFRQMSHCLKHGLGWHYLLDLSWSVKELAPCHGMLCMDAGAGTGIMQWWLAEQGVDVISVDQTSRRDLAARFRRHYLVKGWRKEDLAPLPKPSLRGFLPPRSPLHWHLYPKKLANSVRRWWWKSRLPSASGTIFIYNQDLTSMQDITDASIDNIVSISALEHNSPAKLGACVAELMRVLKPGGKLIATLAAAKEQDWFHAPSKGWCYTEGTLRNIFDLPAGCPSNYECYDMLFEALRDCTGLRDNLADFYFKSGNNGMPWGKWAPKYLPVGVVKVKDIYNSKDSAC